MQSALLKPPTTLTSFIPPPSMSNKGYLYYKFLREILFLFMFFFLFIISSASRTLIRREEREVSHKIFNVIKKWIAKNYYKKIYYIFIQLQKNYLILLILLDNIKEFAIQSQFFHFYLLKTFTTMNNIHKNSYLLQ